MAEQTVLVVGAGPTGLTLAIELRRLGLNVRLIDKSHHPARHSQALVVQSRTLEQFQRYGLAEQAVARGRKLTQGRFFSEGENILSISFDRIQSRYPYVLFLAQTETEQLLTDHLRSLGVQAERGVELRSVMQMEEGVSCALHHDDGRLEQVEYRWVVGCDGAHSIVRDSLAIPFEGGGIGLSFYLGDLELQGPDVPTDELTVHVHHGDVVFLGRLTDKLTRLIVALHGQPEKQPEKELTLQTFQEAVDRMGVKVKALSADWMTPFHVNDRQARHYRVDDAFLAGDAAHIHSPVGGQGMNTGIQDAANLAWKLAAVARGADASLLDSYHEERSEVGKALLRSTERSLKLATVANPLLERLRDLLAPVVSRPAAVQNALVSFISETGIEYRHSSIVSDHGGDGHLRAGDRLPDLNVQTPGGNGALLGDWHEANHLALLLNATEEEQAEISETLEGLPLIALASAQLDDEGRRQLGTDKKLLLLRPDGYIGLRMPVGNDRALEAYMDKMGLAPAAV